MLSPGIRYTLEECIDMPPMVLEEREIPLSNKQKDAYRSMYKKLVYEYENGEISAKNAAVKVQKLLQISSGVLYDSETGETVHLPCQKREEELITILGEQSPQKLIIATHYSATIDKLLAFFKKKKIQALALRGGMSPKGRALAIDAFQDGTLPVLIIQPQAAAHGLTLTVANTVVWYGPTMSNETYTQLNARVRRPGQSRTQIVVRISSSYVERRFFKALDGKEKLSQVLLSLYKDPDWT